MSLVRGKIPREAFSMGRCAGAAWWLRGSTDPGVPAAYLRMGAAVRVLFWAGVLRALAGVYRDAVLSTVVASLSVTLVLAVVLGWGPF